LLRKSRRGLSAAAVGAVVIIAVGGAAVLFLYPSLAGSNGSAGASSTLAITSTTTLFPANGSSYSSTVSTSYTVYPQSSTSSTTLGGWQEWAVANATLGYYRTQAFIGDAWNYTFDIYQSGNGSPNVYTVSDTIGALEMNVTGNWTSGYTLTFTSHEINVTVEYSPPSTYYPVIFFNVQNGSDFQQSIRFNSTQQEAISLALANAGVKSALSQYPYFVDDAFAFPSTNKTFGGDYLVWFFQSNGPRILGAFVNLSAGSVAATYNDTRTTRVCYSGGACYSSPWGYP